MINYKEKIISGKSLGGFEIGKSIYDYLKNIYKNEISVSIKIYNEKSDKEIHSYSIDDNFIINTLPSGEILNVTSMFRYEGTLNETIKCGMTVSEIKRVSKTQSILNGCLFLDSDHGFYFYLISPYDEIGDSIDHLPNDLILNEITVCTPDLS